MQASEREPERADRASRSSPGVQREADGPADAGVLPGQAGERLQGQSLERGVGFERLVVKPAGGRGPAQQLAEIDGRAQAHRSGAAQGPDAQIRGQRRPGRGHHRQIDGAHRMPGGDQILHRGLQIQPRSGERAAEGGVQRGPASDSLVIQSKRGQQAIERQRGRLQRQGEVRVRRRGEGTRQVEAGRHLRAESLRLHLALDPFAADPGVEVEGQVSQVGHPAAR